MQRVLFHVGPLSVYFYGVMLAAGILAGVWLAMREGRRKGINPQDILDFALYAIVAGLIGARLVFVLFDLEFYLANPLEIIRLNEGGLSIHGGILGGALVALWLSRRRELSFWRLGDAIAPSVALGEAIARIGCDIYGAPTTVPWGILIGTQRYHNIPLYTTVALSAVFAVLWSRRKKARYDGEILLWFLILYSAARFIIEYFRVSVSFLGLMTVAQFASLVIIVASLALMRHRLASR
ncbi:MAG: prolipoprotein diacylglyceryl transferase [Syntrophothermus sp.]